MRAKVRPCKGNAQFKMIFCEAKKFPFFWIGAFAKGKSSGRECKNVRTEGKIKRRAGEERRKSDFKKGS